MYILTCIAVAQMQLNKEEVRGNERFAGCINVVVLECLRDCNAQIRMEHCYTCKSYNDINLHGSNQIQ